jgi:hypothetical protein
LSWTNHDTARLACRLLEFGLLVLSVTIVGSWLLERWSGPRYKQD